MRCSRKVMEELKSSGQECPLEGVVGTLDKQPCLANVYQNMNINFALARNVLSTLRLRSSAITYLSTVMSMQIDVSSN